MYKQNKQLVELVEPVVSAMGCELVGIEHLRQGRYSLLRIYIDKVDGITLADCEKVSHQVTGVLDVEDPIQGAYNLEVSSPGLDRPLFTLQQFGRYTGKLAKLGLGTKLEGRRKLSGRIIEAGTDYVLMDVEGTQYKVPADSIDNARLVPEMQDYNFKTKRDDE
ncbi:MAG: ribosome maturation factor RimP [Gammaproteobacteria bacterium]